MKQPVKAYSNPEDPIARLEEINYRMDIISIRATWLLGVKVLIILALASFIANFEAEINVDSLAWVIWMTAIILCLAYSAILLIYIPLLIIPNFGEPIYGKYTIQQQKENIKKNEENLEKLDRHFRTLVYLFIFFPVASFMVIGAWYIIA